MFPYTTPYHKFTLPITVSDVEKIFVTYSMGGVTVCEKDMSECDFVDDHTFVVHLTQEDTGAIKNNRGLVEIQITLLTCDGERMTSRIVRITPGKILKDGEI